jgi:hypothetical protein
MHVEVGEDPAAAGDVSLRRGLMVEGVEADRIERAEDAVGN